MFIKNFFKRPTSDDIMRSRLESGMLMDLGRERVKRRSKKWYNFFSLMALIGNLVFYWEGRKERKELERNNKPIPRILADKKKKEKKKANREAKKKGSSGR